MTTTALPTARAARPGGAGHRILSVTRLHFANPATVIVTPLAILGLIFLVNLVIWALIAYSVTTPKDLRDAQEGFQYTGSSLYLFVYMMVVAIQAMNATFAFAQGLSVTRRDYYLGSALAFGILSVFYTAMFAALGAIETVTHGWGLGGRMFTPVYLGEDALTRTLVVLLAFLLFFGIGTVWGSTYVRWKATGMVVLAAALALIVVGAVALITLTSSWPAVGSWFGSVGILGAALWSLLLTAASGVAGYLLLRRATAAG